ncbi:MAG: LLM class flavin-dependent oxidoreductase, partial [Chloroflexi bacterium]
PYSFQGRHYQVNDAQMFPKPLQSPRIPVWLAGGWPKRKPLRRAARWDGIYLMTVNQVTGELLTPEEVREIVAYIRTYRESADPFDVAVNGEIPAGAQNGSEIVQAYQEAGATWWIELEGSGESFEKYRARIRRGPPK